MGRGPDWRRAVYPAPDATGAHLPELDVDLRGLRIKGSMDWREAPAHTVFEGSLEADDIGEVLKNWRYAPTITSDSFVTNAALNWPGSPAAFALRTSSGTLGIEARDGMLQSGEGSAEALRVFGLLNFNALTRRLRLDFSDTVQQGDSLRQPGRRPVCGEWRAAQRAAGCAGGPRCETAQLEGSLNLRA
ncbi:AsmA-like C-terminal region-containing protein [Halopseudomonas pachastrellae]|nr:AsmA-like C-terminal region-containing protein [Halopseudomonas pachastrellae]